MKRVKLILIVNAKWPSIKDKIKQLYLWFSPLCDLDITLVETNFTDIPFTIYRTDLKEAKGIDSVWYDQHISVPFGKGFDMVLFCLETKDWPTVNYARGWRGDNFQGVWEAQIAADENEKIYTFDEDLGTMKTLTETFFSYARHEIAHCLYALTGQLDRTHEFFDFKNWKPEGILTDINFDSPKTVDTISLLERLIIYLKQLIGLYETRIELMDEQTKIEKFCLAIKEKEGWFPPGVHSNYPDGTRAWRNKSPGNVRYVPGMRLAIGKDKSGFAIFKDEKDGMDFLIGMVTKACKGLSKIYKPDDTFYEYFAKFAPTNDGNNPRAYAEFVAESVGCSPNSSIDTLL